MRPIVTNGVAWSVCRSVYHDREPCKYNWILLRWAQGSMY